MGGFTVSVLNYTNVKCSMELVGVYKFQVSRNKFLDFVCQLQLRNHRSAGSEALQFAESAGFLPPNPLYQRIGSCSFRFPQDFEDK